MSGRPTSALNEAVAFEVLRQARSTGGGSASDLAVALADEILACGGWKANSCQPLLRAYEIAASSGGTS